MKNKFWILMAIAAMVLMSCDTDQKQGPQPIYCPDTDNDGNGHLGIGEDCIKDTGECTGLKSYGTADDQKIHRVGSLDAAFTDANIQNAANIIMNTYGNFKPEQLANVTLNDIVQILKTGTTEYNAKKLKVLFNDPSIASYLNGKAGPAYVYCPDKDGNGHLGIGEDCIKNTGNCSGLQDYRPAAAQAKPEPYNPQVPGDYFPWPIYRVGALTESNYPGTTLDDTVASILAGYKMVVPRDKEFLNRNDCGLVEVHVTYNAPGGKYTWTGTELGIQTGLSGGNVRNFLGDIAVGVDLGPDDDLPHVTPIGNAE